MSRTPFFDDAQRAMLMTFVRDGKLTVPLFQVAKELGTSEATVRGEIKRNSIAPFQERRFNWTKPLGYTPEMKAALLNLVDSQGRLTVTLYEAAAELACSLNDIRRALTKYRIRIKT